MAEECKSYSHSLDPFLCVGIAQYIGGYGSAELDDVICNMPGAVTDRALYLGGFEADGFQETVKEMVDLK